MTRRLLCGVGGQYIELELEVKRTDRSDANNECINAIFEMCRLALATFCDQERGNKMVIAMNAGNSITALALNYGLRRFFAFMAYQLAGIPISRTVVMFFLLFQMTFFPQLKSAENAELVEHFERRVRPLLLSKCVDCHSEDYAEGGLSLGSREGLERGADSGAVLIPGDPESSRLIQLVRGAEALQMPPDSTLTPQEIAILEKWIADGAVWPEYDRESYTLSSQDPDEKFTEQQRSHWAFRPVAQVDPPQLEDTSWIQSPIDAFILEKLNEAGLAPALPLEKQALLRRVTFDLTGLPPTPQEIADFLADDSPKAFENVVDRLLDSPRYGERWARYWLDVVRFGETAAHDGNNAYLHAWRYRDYVVQAFNEDMPYDQFITEQLAGDLLPRDQNPAIHYDQLVATGFLQVGPKPVVMRDKRQMHLDIADEQLHTTGVAFLGLTLGCARCHDHKFDPIPIEDYYSLAGIFTSTKTMADQEPDSKWLEVEIPDSHGQAINIMAVEDSQDPHNLAVHRRGSYQSLGKEAPRRFLQIIAGVDHPPIEAEGSGRLELARWISAPENPLTARVMVNRIWQQHFGRGIVATSDNFGMAGEEPSHPQLLDWLASKFIETGYSIKAMHRLMVLSSTYQQSSAGSSNAESIDPENRLLWKFPKRRLDAESIRDAMLFVSGELDLSEGGNLFRSGFAPNDLNRELFVVDISGSDYYPPFVSTRRSIYLPVLRNSRPEILKLFDVANEHESTTQRVETIVPTQALYLLNSSSAFRQADSMAMRVLDEVTSRSEPKTSDQAGEIVDLAYRLALGRTPSDVETRQALEFLTEIQSKLEKSQAELQNENSDFVQHLKQMYHDSVRQSEKLLHYSRMEQIKFDGSTRIMVQEESRSPYQFRQEITIEFWIRPSEVRSSTILARGDGFQSRNWRIGIDAITVDGSEENVLVTEFFQPNAGGRRIQENRRELLLTNTWNHVATTFDKGLRRVYLNGIKVDECRVDAESILENAPLSIGAEQDKTNGFVGELDLVAIYDRVLPESTIVSHARTCRRTEWPVDALPMLYSWQNFCHALFCFSEFLYVE